VNKNLSPEERDVLLKDIDQIVAWSRDAVELIKKIYCDRPDFHNGFGYFKSCFMSLVRDDGALDLYHGGLRANDEHGQTIFDHVDYSHYWDYVHEEVKSWSYMKFPFIRSRGREEGWYRVGRSPGSTIATSFRRPWPRPKGKFSRSSAAAALLSPRWPITGRA